MPSLSIVKNALRLLESRDVIDYGVYALAGLGLAGSRKFLPLLLKVNAPERHVKALVRWNDLAAVDRIFYIAIRKHAAILRRNPCQILWFNPWNNLQLGAIAFATLGMAGCAMFVEVGPALRHHRGGGRLPRCRRWGR
jgi:hypothetical protein